MSQHSNASSVRLKDPMERVEMFQWGTDYINTIDEEERWLLKPLIPAGGLVDFYGKPKTGKTFAAFGIAAAVSGGLPEWNGFEIRTHGPIAVVQADTPRPETKSRLRNFDAAGYDLSKFAIIDNRMMPYPFNILLPQHRAYLREQIATIKPVFVVIDTLREIHEGDENDSTDMKKVINAVVDVAGGAAIGFISHSRKDSAFNAMGAESDLMDERRGSSYVSGRMDTVVRFTGKGEPVKGTMHYKGRSGSGKMPYVQEPSTGFVVRATEYAAQEQAVALIVAREKEFPTLRAMANELVNMGIFANYKTAERHIKAMKERATT